MFNTPVSVAATPTDRTPDPLNYPCSRHPLTRELDNLQHMIGLHWWSRALPLVTPKAAKQPGPSRQTPFASRSVRRALLIPQANPGSLYRCGQSA